MFFNSSRKNIIKTTLLYTLSDGVCKGISFITLPIVSYYIVPSQLGICANFDVMVQILMLLAGQVIIGALPYNYYNKNKEEIRVWVSNLIFLILSLNVVLLVVVLIMHHDIERFLCINLPIQILSFVSVCSHLITSINTLLLRLEERPYTFCILQITQTILYVSCLFLFVIHLKFEAIGKIYSTVISCAIIAFVHIAYLHRRGYLRLYVNKKIIYSLIAFALPLLPHSLSFWFKSGTDKILLTEFCGLAANGLYSMAMSFGAIYTIFNTAFSNAFIPYLQKRINSFTNDNIQEEQRKIVRLIYSLSGLFIILYAILIVICWICINYLLNEKYIPSFQFIPWILLSLVFNSIYGMFIQFPYTVKKTKGIGLITFSGSMIQFAMSYLLINYLGVDGIKISIVAGSFIIMVGIWWYSNKVYPLPWFSLNK